MSEANASLFGLALFTQSRDAIIIVRLNDNQIVDVNPAAESFYHEPRNTLIGRVIDQRLRWNDPRTMIELLESRSHCEQIGWPKHASRDTLPCRIHIHTVTTDTNYAVLLIQPLSNTERNESRSRQHRVILEMIATGQPATKILESLVQLVEDEHPPVRCSILILDETGKYLLHGAAPRLPQFYQDAVNRYPIGPMSGSCGAAAYTKQRVIVPDIQTHPYWEPYRELARKAGLRSCWSEPIFSSDQRVLGTFAIYHDEPHEPTAREIETVALSTSLASIAIERTQSLNKIQDSQRMLRTVLDNIPLGVFWKNQHSEYLGCNRVVAHAFGLADPSEVIGLNDYQLASLTVPQADFFVAKDKQVMTNKAPELGIIEQATLANGQTIWMETNKIPLIDQHSEVVGILGTWQDITQRKIAEESLRASEQRLSAIAATMPHALYVFDIIERKTIYSNRELWRELGYSPDELTHLGDDFVVTLLHPDDAARLPSLLARWEHTKDDTILEVEYRMRHRSGEWRWFLGRDTVYERDQQNRVTRIIGTIQDITARKLADDALRKSEQKYRDLVETSHDLIWSLDDAGCWTFVNRHGATTTYGYEAEEMLGRSIIEFAVPTQRENDRMLIHRVLHGESIFQHLTEHQRKDGSTVYLQYNAVPLFGDDGRVIGATGTASDLTERLRIENALRQSEAHLRTILEHEPECVKLLNPEGLLITMNPAGLAMIDADSLEQVQGNCVYPLISPEYQSSFRALVQQTFQGQSGQIEFEITSLKGNKRWFEMNAAPLKDSHGQVMAMLSVTRDISERKNTEKQLRANQYLLEGVSRLQRDFLVELDPHQSFDRVLNFLLQSTESAYGFFGEVLKSETNEPYIKAYSTTNIAWNDETRAFYDKHAKQGLEFRNLQTLFGAALRTGQPVIANDPSNDSRRGGLPTGHPPLHSFLGIPLYHGDEMIGIIGLANRPQGYDMELVKYLDPLTATCASLVYAFRLERNRQVADEERRQLETKILQAQKLESLGVLAGGIAHDFNNLLTSILGYTDLALGELPEGSHVRPLIDEAVHGARRAAELTKQMLAYSGKGRFVIEPINLTHLTEDMTRLLKISISKKCTLIYQLAPELPSIEADAIQIRQIIMNLIINASEALGEQQGTITVSTGVMICNRDYLSESYLDENLQEGPYVYVEIADTGSGMSATTRSKIFDPFFTTKFTGRGLGLSAVLGIVRGHRGAIKCQSELGRGTTFRVLFPASQLPSRNQHVEFVQTTKWQSSGTVLIVDDEEAVLSMCRHMLVKLGFDVISACNGQEAVARFEQMANDIRFVLLDMMMPHMDGVETFLAIRRLKPDVKVILTSGYNEQTATNRFIGQGLAGFLQKPYTLEQMQKTIENILSDTPR